MISCGMLRRVAIVRTDVWKEISAYFILIMVFLRSLRRLLVTAGVVPNSPIISL
jgi:hypothetical protein